MERARATAAVALFAFLLAATVALAVAAPALRQAALEPAKKTFGWSGRLALLLPYALGLLVLVLTACDQHVLIAGPSSDPGRYEVVGLVAE